MLESREKMLAEALGWALEYIDAIPKDVQLPAMPGFDRDYVDELLYAAKVDIALADAARKVPLVFVLDESGSMDRHEAGKEVGLRAKLAYPGSRVSDFWVGDTLVQIANKDLSKAAFVVFTDGEPEA